jgi:hypothetical protein
MSYRENNVMYSFFKRITLGSKKENENDFFLPDFKKEFWNKLLLQKAIKSVWK